MLDRHPDECKFRMLGTWHASQDPWADTSREHPRQAASRPRIHRQIVLVAEKERADERNGIAIVRLESGHGLQVLARVSASIAVA